MKSVSITLLHPHIRMISAESPASATLRAFPYTQTVHTLGTFAEAHQHNGRNDVPVKVILHIRLGAFLVHGTFDIDGEEWGRRLFVGERNWAEEELPAPIYCRCT